MCQSDHPAAMIVNAAATAILAVVAKAIASAVATPATTLNAGFRPKPSRVRNWKPIWPTSRPKCRPWKNIWPICADKR